MKGTKIIIVMILLSSIAFAQDISMFIQLGLNNGEMSVEEVDLSEGVGSNRPFLDAEYTGIVSSLSKNRTTVTFNFPSYIYLHTTEDIIPLKIEESILNDTAQSLFFPYYPDVNKLEVFDINKNLILTYDLSEWRTCDSNSFCSGNENPTLCPSDCEKEIITEEIIINEKKKITKEKETSKTIPITLLIILLLIVIVLILTIRKKKFSKSKIL